MKTFILFVVMIFVFSWCFFSYSKVERKRWEAKADAKVKKALSDPNFIKNAQAVEANSISK